MKIKKNIKLILKESYRWRNRNLIEKAGFIEPKISLKNILTRNVFLFLIGLIFSICFSSFFNPKFAGYAITALSIFIGLFTTVLILIFDKLVNNQNLNNLENASSELKLNLKRTKNFSRRFIFISLEALLIATCIIVLFLIPLMFQESFTINILNYEFVLNKIDYNSFSTLIKNSIIVVTRILLVVLLYKFFKYLFMIFGALGAYLKGVLNNNVKI